MHPIWNFLCQACSNWHLPPYFYLLSFHSPFFKSGSWPIAFMLRFVRAMLSGCLLYCVHQCRYDPAGGGVQVHWGQKPRSVGRKSCCSLPTGNSSHHPSSCGNNFLSGCNSGALALLKVKNFKRENLWFIKIIDINFHSQKQPKLGIDRYGYFHQASTDMLIITDANTENFSFLQEENGFTYSDFKYC